MTLEGSLFRAPGYADESGMGEIGLVRRAVPE
jgi:hypothetical protein